MADLRDGRVGGASLEAVGRMALKYPRDQARTDLDEDEYRAYREPVLSLLRHEFRREYEALDLEELYHEAWLVVIAMRRRGEHIANTRRLLQKIAWRKACDRTRKHRPELLDPMHAELLNAEDTAPLPEEHARVKLDAAAARVLVEALDERQAAAIKLRFDEQLAAAEIQERLGVSARRLEIIFTRAYKRIAAQLVADDSGETAWERRQRSLLLLCETGLASPRQRARAQRLVDNDVRCAAMLGEMRRALRDVAALLPMPVLAEPTVRRFSGLQSVLDRVADLWVGSRHLSEELTTRGVVSSGAIEQAGAGGASLVGLGATAKLVALCVAMGGTVAVCVKSVGLIEHKPPQHRKADDPKRRSSGSARQPVRREPPVATTYRPAHHTTRKAPTSRETRTSTNAAVSSVKYQAPASPAPAGSQEFGPGVIGSSSATAGPAPAPSDGGGEFTP